MTPYFIIALLLLKNQIIGGADDDEDDIYDLCNRYNCIGKNVDDANCFQNKNCEFVVGIVYDNSEHFFIGHFYSKDITKYVALGISRDAAMGDDDVIACFLIDEQPTFLFARNQNGRRPPQTEKTMPANGKSEDGKFQCKLDIKLDELPDSFKYKDYNVNKYYLLIAAGKVNGTVDGTSPSGPLRLAFHKDKRFGKSGTAIDFTKTSAGVKHIEHMILIGFMIMTCVWMFSNFQ